MPSDSNRDPALRLRLLIGILIGVAGGYAIGLFTVRVYESPTLRLAATESQAAAIPADSAESEERLLALGYSSGSARATGASGVTQYDEEFTFDSYNLMASGDRPGAALMDMNGRVVHQWARSFAEVWPDADPGEQNVNFWRRVHLFDNGDILAIFDGLGIFRIDKDSNLIWANDCGAHHDMVVEADGHVFVLARKKQMVDLNDGEGIRPVLEDFVVELDANGQELRRASILKAMRSTAYESLIMDAPTHWDIFHTNSIERIRDGQSGGLPAFEPGRFLLSIRELSTIAVLDFDAEEIVWALKGQWLVQHEATPLDSGRILLFDNEGNGGRSKVIEIDPRTQEIAWAYGTGDDESLDSPFCGQAQRLPNGNTLINEAVPGRVIEVTPHGKIVWEYINPSRTREDADIIASVMDFQRLPQSFEPGWLERAARRPAGGLVE